MGYLTNTRLKTLSHGHKTQNSNIHLPNHSFCCRLFQYWHCFPIFVKCSWRWWGCSLTLFFHRRSKHVSADDRKMTDGLKYSSSCSAHLEIWSRVQSQYIWCIYFLVKLKNAVKEFVPQRHYVANELKQLKKIVTISVEHKWMFCKKKIYIYIYQNYKYATDLLL